MSSELRLTIPEVAASIERTTGKRYPTWKVRRIVDALEFEGVIDIQRCGLYRTVAASNVPRIADELQIRGRTTATATANA